MHLPLIDVGPVDSTQHAARALFDEGAVHGTVVWSRAQHAARGRLSRRFYQAQHAWTFSMVLRPNIDASIAHRLTLAAALGIRDGLVAMFPQISEHVKIKWPNDLVFIQTDLTKKFAGLLIESCSFSPPSLTGAILGVGINVADEQPPADIADIFGSLAMLGVAVAPGSEAQHIEALRPHVLGALCRVQDDFDGIRGALCAHSATLGRDVDASDGNSRVRGFAEGFDAEGALQLRLPDGERRTVRAGDVWPAGQTPGPK